MITMENVKEKSIISLNAEKVDSNTAIRRSVDILKEQHYEIIENLAVGGYGTILKAIDQWDEKFAVKIVLQNDVNKNELEIWPTLKHKNIISLIDVQYLSSAGTYAFIMPLVANTLDILLENSVFSTDVNGFHRATSYLLDALKGVNYLHGQNLCHLDIKLSNILVSYSGKALLCDFSSLTKTDAGTDCYLSPYLYRPAEAVTFQDSEKAVVNGFSYDVYTIGLLALELFTNQSVLKSSKSIEIDSKWCDVMYPTIFKMLEKKQFERSVKKTFCKSKIDKNLIAIMRNFIKGCMNLNPRLRPSVDDILNHKIFGGSRLFHKHKNDVWENRASSEKLNFLISLFVAQAATLYLPSDSQNSCNIDAPDLKAKKNPVEQELEVDSDDNVCEEQQHVPVCESEARFTRKQIFIQWISRKKSGLFHRFYRIASALSRK